MLTRELDIIKESHFDCRDDTTKLKISLFCEKCITQSNNKRTKQFDNCKSLYFHLLHDHSRLDKFENPSRDECIIKLQVISDSIKKGVLKR